MIEVKDLVKSYNKRIVVNHVSLKMQRGEIIGLLGPNGAGKTTIFYIIVGLIQANAGEIYLDGQKITHLAMHKRSRAGLGYLPQESSIFNKLTVEENILILWELLKEIRPKNPETRLKELLDEIE